MAAGGARLGGPRGEALALRVAAGLQRGVGAARARDHPEAVRVGPRRHVRAAAAEARVELVEDAVILVQVHQLRGGCLGLLGFGPIQTSPNLNIPWNP